MTTQASDMLRLVPVEPLERILTAAEQFITNGVEFGYVRMPEFVADPAHDTLPMIREGLKLLAASPAVQPAAGRVSADDIAAVREMIGIEYYAGKDAWAQALERILAAISTPAQASETGGEVARLRAALDATIKADDALSRAVWAEAELDRIVAFAATKGVTIRREDAAATAIVNLMKLIDAQEAALSAPQAAPGEGEQL